MFTPGTRSPAASSTNPITLCCGSGPTRARASRPTASRTPSSGPTPSPPRHLCACAAPRSAFSMNPKPSATPWRARWCTGCLRIRTWERSLLAARPASRFSPTPAAICRVPASLRSVTGWWRCCPWEAAMGSRCTRPARNHSPPVWPPTRSRHRARRSLSSPRTIRCCSSTWMFLLSGMRATTARSWTIWRSRSSARRRCSTMSATARWPSAKCASTRTRKTGWALTS